MNIQSMIKLLLYVLVIANSVFQVQAESVKTTNESGLIAALRQEGVNAEAARQIATTLLSVQQQGTQKIIETAVALVRRQAAPSWVIAGMTTQILSANYSGVDYDNAVADLAAAITEVVATSREEVLKVVTSIVAQSRIEAVSVVATRVAQTVETEMAPEIAKVSIEQIINKNKHTAIIYPMTFPNRTEMLVILSDSIQQVIVPVTAEVLKQTLFEFRRNLQTRTNYHFIDQAKQLYNWFIAPIRPELEKREINTLVFALANSSLRMIPIGTFYDGKQFLIHDFAIATVPGLNMVDTSALPRWKNTSVLLNGLSEKVQDFSALTSTEQEVKNISALFEKSTILFNEQFSLKNVTKSLQDYPYSIVHIASHGQFDRDPTRTFLLTHDDKLTMDRLRLLLAAAGSRKKPVELLTLSACETAVGDERSALGLAGLAVKTGVRSAIASLWFVDDIATSELITRFYQELQDPSLSKVQALQKAQKKLGEKQEFRHPAYWAPFILVGNWL